ncbi:MAG: ABC transporter ATP-binding protein [Clostridiales bacterium]|jgi:peptide/nickel transport system ATP-binding protein|nr:ABC transporter ATP-binding protein [Clostridiales bacterium]
MQMRNPENIAEFDDLRVRFASDGGVARAVDGLSLDIPRGNTVGLVGESGCGKSVAALTMMGLLPEGVASGAIRFQGGAGTVDLAAMPERARAKLRGAEIAMVFQEPMTSLNPVLRIGAQLGDAVRLLGLSRAEVRGRVEELLARVGVPAGVAGMYPHELSGGMRQRALIALALARGPKLLIADEPTTALDATIQMQILDLLSELRDGSGLSMLLISHDLGVIAEMADEVAVMYAGRAVERGNARDVLKHPAHPYTAGLIASRPDLGRRGRLASIPGSVPDPAALPEHCRFFERCARRMDACRGEYPREVQLGGGHGVECRLYADGGEAHG